ncbi:glycosyltransferase [Sulfitobacter sp. M57]|uniref:glycosyltransferase n=1 Tax=unclassified Sulfitobacter TaxID=196795 RepID=UPI0023E2EBF0|nr:MULTISPECIES: glycosyltransferase [unclassified Sulfitobacter]MDF3415049.1 glycosyltransferase [Sulfitobacter sp. KE5]MDF3422530.1 glycosyltransferase [Sulfitobacter sp. KE43]MDF3433595.1 glycosyltransferase [Sulfitobacter sp. KE42]MDF3459235.1 glycosyltransferase [Sulfitobacter sp. S74]MDF3463134.1 glycosyltransferase [Sulfitobacter sp. Ks18]
MSRLPLLTLIKRFGSALRREGTGAAVRRSVNYLRRRARGAGIGTVPLATDTGPRGSERYLHGVWQNLAQQDAFHILQAPSVDRARRQIAMIADLNLPQCRKYRVEQLAGFWRSRGVEFEYAHYQDIPRATRIMQHATHLMEYRLQSGAATDMFRYEARRLRLPILYDLDDPLFSVSAYETYRNMEALDPALKSHFVAEAPKYLSMMNGADILSVSTPGMAQHAGLYSGRPIFVRRNFADVQTLHAGAAAMADNGADDGMFRVAFASGSQGHEIDLAEILPPLSAFIQADRNRRLMLIGHFDLTHLPEGLKPQIETVAFRDYDRYLSAVARADCTVMPLCDDAFNRCKSAVRVLDAASVGVPSIVAGVGDLASVVNSGETGIVVQQGGSWMQALREIAACPKAAAQMGRNARANLEERWCASDQPHIIAPELIEWVEA